jgi:hypothetical protein
MTPMFKVIVLGIGLCLALAGTAQAQLELGVGGFLDQSIPTAVAAMRWGDFGVETGFGLGKSDFVSQGHRFYASGVSASGMLKMYVPVAWPAVTPYVGAGATMMNFEVASAGETFPTVYSTATGFQGIAGVEATIPGMPLHIYLAGNYSTLDSSIDIQAGGQTVHMTNLLKAKGPSASVGFRLEFSISDI